MFGPTLGAPTMATPVAESTLVSSELAMSYGVSELVSAELAMSYGVAALVSADLALSYGVNELVGAELAMSYAVESAVILVGAELAMSYGVSALVSADLSMSYAVNALVGATLAMSYAVESEEVIMSFTKSTERTVTVSPGAKPFTASAFWTMTDPKKPRSPKDPDATLDYSFDWTPWLADAVDSAASHQIVVGEGLTNAGSSLVGTVVTVFVSGGTLETRVPVTCRITTASVPPRVVDRTIYLDIEAQ